MTRSPVRRGRYRAVALALLTATLVPGLAQLPALATSPTTAHASSSDDVTHPLGSLGDPVAGLTDLDARGTALPTATQRSAAADLGAVDLRWNQFGTPSSILPADGVLARATSSDPVVAARVWLRRQRRRLRPRPPTTSPASSWSTTSCWPTATPTRCSSARGSAS